MKIRHIGTILFSLLAIESAVAGVTVFDFEDDAQVAAWRIRSAGQDTLVRSPKFATSGESSLLFNTPAWKRGMNEWPAFEAKPPVADWRPYDRLVVDITNPNDERYFFALLISDSKVGFQKGLSFRFELPSKGFRRFVIPLSQFPKSVDRSDISIVHFFGQRPKTAMALHLDNIVLLRKGEAVGEPPSAVVRQLADLFLQGFGSFDGLVAECRASVAPLCDTAEMRRRADAELAAVEARVGAIRDELKLPGITLSRMEELRTELGELPLKLKRVVSVAGFEKSYAALGLPDNGVLIGFASSMEKVLPRDMPIELAARKSVELSLARNEKEAFQVAVLPRRQALKQVALRVGDLRSDAGDTFSATNIDCDVMGYVETKKRPPYAVSYVGWWPDPILDLLGPIDIAAGDVQTFWIRVRAPKDQKPDVYRGTLTVTAKDLAPVTFPFVLTVRSFALPDHTALPTAITFFERKAQMGGEENWDRMKFAYADFLADYCIDYDSLYRAGPPDFEIVRHLHDHGRLVAFNLGNVFNAGIKDTNVDAAIAATVDRLRPAYERAKEMGLLDHAYIYGFDERGKDQFPLLEQCAAALRKAFPEVLLMTTSYDHSYGLDSVVRSIDAWCPLTPRFDIDKAAKARAAGKKVWWYICCGPHNPHANWFVEYAAIESRLLMGAMTAKYRPDGFLYYSLSIWNQNEPIESGPFTDWNPVSWTTYHGDGSLLCSGPGGKPVPTIRLENYRDGMEDYAYVCILEEIVRQQEAKRTELSETQRQWLAEATAALAVPETLVKTMSEYSHDPRVLYMYRDRLGDLIDRSGVADANPWGDNFGVRGFSGTH